MANLQRAKDQIKAASYLSDQNITGSGHKESIIAHLQEAIRHLQAPEPQSQEVIVKQTRYNRVCGYPKPRKTRAWYHRVRLRGLDGKHHLPNCYILVDPALSGSDYATIVGVSKSGPILGPAWMEGRKVIGFRHENGKFFTEEA